MKRKPYHSERIGAMSRNQRIEDQLKALKRCFSNLYSVCERKHLFDEAFGFTVIHGHWEDDRSTQYVGDLGNDVGAYFYKELLRDYLFPIDDKSLQLYDEHDLFDVIECLYGLVSFRYDKEGSYTFGKEEGQKFFRQEINELLQGYKNGYELSEKGEVQTLFHEDFSDLQKIPVGIDGVDREKYQNAVRKYRRHKATIDEKQDALKNLYEILEYHRDDDLSLLSSDERELFKLFFDKKKGSAVPIFRFFNQFGIRHHNDEQKLNYDKEKWYDFVFLYCSIRIHLFFSLKGNNVQDSLKNPERDQISCSSDLTDEIPF